MLCSFDEAKKPLAGKNYMPVTHYRHTFLSNDGLTRNKVGACSHGGELLIRGRFPG